jgi:integrase
MAKRGQNEGSIYKRKDGRWVAVLNLGYQKGKLKRKPFYGKTRAEVADRLNTALGDRKRGIPIITDRQTVGQFLDRWLADSAKPAVRQSTCAIYSQLIRLYVKPELGHVRLEKLTPQQTESWLNGLLAAGLSPRTVQHARAVLRRALRHAMKWELVSRNVATLVDPPRQSRKEIMPFSQDEVRTFLQSVEGHRFETLFYLSLALGLRQGEALGLRWQDVDLKRGTLTVSGSLQRVDGTLRLVEPKTERSRRTLPLHAGAAAKLGARRALQLQEQQLAGTRWKDSGLVFTSGVGTPLIARNVVRSYHRALSDAGLPRRRFYDLRHSCATMLLAQGVPARVIMEVLGHSQISLTMNTYAHVSPALLKEATDSLEPVLAGV